MPTVTPGAIIPFTPYPVPVPPPTGLGVTRVSVTLDEAWLPYVIGCCKALICNSTFDPPDPGPAIEAIKSAYNLLGDLSNPQPVVTTVPNSQCCGDCEDCDMGRLQFSCGVLQEWDCVTQMWVDVPSVGNCAANPAPGADIPSTEPGGRSPLTCFNVDASTLTPLPFLVNTGDELIFTNVKGAGTDGVGSQWYCPDGSIYFLGACAGGGGTSSGDPLNTTNHMALLLKIGSSYYPLTASTFTVPSGVANEQPFVQVNTPTIGNARGSYSLCMYFQNNSVSAWRAHLNFRSNSGGFVTNPGLSPGAGVWTPPNGWLGSVGIESGPVYVHGCYLQLNLSSAADIVGITINGSKVDGSSINPSNTCFELYDQAANNLVTPQTFGSMPSSPFSMTGSGHTGVTQVNILLWDYEFSTPGGYGTTTITDLYLNGNGVVPPELMPFLY